MKTIIVLVSLLLCALAQAKSQSYYYGTVKYSSVDGTLPMGETVSLVSRTLDPEMGLILERVLQPKEKAPGADEFITEMKLKNGNTFAASDTAQTFSGEIVFFGSPWSWTTWDYQVNLTKGGVITGSGFLTEQGILTNKTLRTANFKMKILEDLKTISEAEYLKIRNRLIGH